MSNCTLKLIHYLYFCSVPSPLRRAAPVVLQQFPPNLLPRQQRRRRLRRDQRGCINKRPHGRRGRRGCWHPLVIVRQPLDLHLRHPRPQEARHRQLQLLQVLVGQAQPDVVLFAAQTATLSGQRAPVRHRQMGAGQRRAHPFAGRAVRAAVRNDERARHLLRRRGVEQRTHAGRTVQVGPTAHAGPMPTAIGAPRLLCRLGGEGGELEIVRANECVVVALLLVQYNWVD